MEKKGNLETLEIQSKKKKNTLFIVVIGALLAVIVFSFVNTLLSVDDSKIYEKRSLDKMDDLNIIKNPEYKENWAISMENRAKKQENRVSELVDLVKNQQDVVLSKLKTVINENNENLKAQLSLIKDSQEAKYKDLEKMINKKFEIQDDRIAQIEQMTKEQISAIKEDNLGDDLVLGKDLVPKRNFNDNLDLDNLDIGDKEKLNKALDNALEQIKDPKLKEALLKNPNMSAEDKINFLKSNKEENKTIEEPKVEEKPKEEPKPISHKKKMVVVDIDTSFNQKIIKAQMNINKKIQAPVEEALKPYHISTGFMTAYMVTGAYAPAFQEGSMEPLPVLFEAEGDIIMANDTIGSLDKCFLLGSAKGNMNSETADIKLVSINCLINGGEYRIEGTISGWVIGENGTPGLQGELLHKNGAWLARTFVSGFFETFSSALAGGNTQTIDLGNSSSTGSTETSTGEAINGNLLSAGASGISNVFSKLGEYYLKMAEQIFPVIEVKGGRTVSILLIGGEDLTLVENNVVRSGDMSDKAAKKQLEKERKLGRIDYENAFTKVVTEEGNTETSSQQNTEEGFGDIPEALN